MHRLAARHELRGYSVRRASLMVAQPCKNRWFGGRFGHFFVFRGVGYIEVEMYGNVGLNTFSFTDSKRLA